MMIEATAHRPTDGGRPAFARQLSLRRRQKEGRRWLTCMAPLPSFAIQRNKAVPYPLEPNDRDARADDGGDARRSRTCRYTGKRKQTVKIAPTFAPPLVLLIRSPTKVAR